MPRKTQGNIEVEIRGPLTKKHFLELQKFFSKEGKFKKPEDRILIDYSTLLSNEGIENRKKDIRIRATNGVPEIIIKTGKWGGTEERKELSLLGKPGEFDKMVQIFGALGFTKGVLFHRIGKVYLYKGADFSLVEVPRHSYYFEAEKLINEEKDKTKTSRAIKKICRELQLDLWDDKGFYDYIKRLNKEVNEVFNFKNYKENYFRKRFGL